MALPTENRLYFLRRKEGVPEKDPATGKSVLWGAPSGWNAILFNSDYEGAGFERVVVNNVSDYLSGHCVDTTDAPTIKPVTPAAFAVGDVYKWRFKLSDIATAAAGTILSGATLAGKPAYITMTSEQSAGETIYEVRGGPVPVGTTTIPLVLVVAADNGKTATLSVSALPKTIQETTIEGYYRDNFDRLDIFIGPDSLVPPVLSYVTYPAGFTDVAPKNMTPIQGGEFGDIQPKFALYTNSEIAGDYVIKVIHLGQTLYAKLTRTGLIQTQALTFSSDIPDTTTPTGSATWAPFTKRTLRQGEQYTQTLPGTGFSSTVAVQKIEVVGNPPSGFNMQGGPNDQTRFVEWIVPNTQQPGEVSIVYKVTLVDGQTVTNTQSFTIIAVPYFAFLDRESDTVDRFWLGPLGFGLPTFQVVAGPQGWTDFSEKTFERWDSGTLADGKQYNYRMRQLKFPAGNFVVKLAQVQAEGQAPIVQYVAFSGPVGTYILLQLSSTVPDNTGQVFYTATVDNGGVNEGSFTYVRFYRYTQGQQPTPASGASLVIDDAGHSGIVFDPLTGYVQVALNDVVSDSYVQPYHIVVNGQNVYSGTFTVNDTTGGNSGPVDTIDHSFEDNTGVFTSDSAGNTEGIVYTGPTNLDEGAAIEATALANLSDGSVISNLSLFKLYLATQTGAFVQATTSGSAYIGGVRLGSNGHMTADVNSIQGDTKVMRVKFEYGSLSLIQPITINDKTSAPAQAITKVWLRRTADTSGNVNIRLAVEGVGKFDYKPITSNPGLYDWQGFILPVTGQPSGNVGTQVSVPSSLLTPPATMQIRLTDAPTTVVSALIPAPDNVWHQVYPQ